MHRTPRVLISVLVTVLVSGGVLLAGPTSSPAAPGPAAAGDGPQARIVSLLPLPGGGVRVVSDVVLPAADAPALPGGDALVTLSTATGEGLRRAAEEPARIRAELPVVAGDTRLTGLSVPDPSPVVRVRVPVDADIRDVTLRLGGERHASSYRLGAQRRAAEPARVALPGWTLGPSSNRLDVVVLGDGYTAAQQADFVADATEVADDVFGVTPFAEYRDFVNVVGIFVPSAQSGADQPGFSGSCQDSSPAPTCCPDGNSAGAAVRTVDTRYDSTFCSQGIQRLLVPGDAGAVYADADAGFPAWEQVLVVVNDEQYGGSGGAIATTSTNPSGAAVMSHELGHSLLGLDDEYDTFTPGYPPCSDMPGVGDPPCQPNVTDVTSRESLKWQRWVDPATAIPTPGQPGPDVVGLFKGAHYSPDTWYRSCFDCLMRSLGQPLGAVGSEQLPLRLFGDQFDVGLIEPGSMSHPADETVVVAPGESTTLSLGVLSTEPAPGTRVTWTVDGVQTSASTVSTGVASLEVTGTEVAQQVAATVESLPGVLHPDDVGISRVTRTWTVAPTADAVAPGTATGVATGPGRRYVKLGAAVDCATALLDVRLVAPRRAPRVKSVVFSAGGAEVGRVRGGDLPRELGLALDPGTGRVSAVVKRRGAPALTVERSYAPC